MSAESARVIPFPSTDEYNAKLDAEIEARDRADIMQAEAHKILAELEAKRMIDDTDPDPV